MACPYCGEGPICRARFRPNGGIFRICAECDTVWRETDGIAGITNYSLYTKMHGLAPLWDQLELLAVAQDGKETLWNRPERAT